MMMMIISVELRFYRLVGRDNFSCLVFGRSQIGFYRQGEAPILLESSLFDVN